MFALNVWKNGWIARSKSSFPEMPLNPTLTVNGRHRHLSVDPRVTLLDALREHHGFTGTKKSCD